MSGERSGFGLAGAAVFAPPLSSSFRAAFVGWRFWRREGRGLRKKGVPPFQRGAMFPSRLRRKTEIRQGVAKFRPAGQGDGPSRQHFVQGRSGERGWRAVDRRPASGWHTASEISSMKRAHVLSSACWRGMPSRCACERRLLQTGAEERCQEERRR